MRMPRFPVLLLATAVSPGLATGQTTLDTPTYRQLKAHLDSIPAIDTHDHLFPFEQLPGYVETEMGKGMNLAGLWRSSYLPRIKGLTPWQEERQPLAVDILAAHVQAGQQRQADGTPQRVADDPRQRDPHMTINELGAGRSRRRIVVNARPLDFRPIALARRVVDGQQDPTLRDDHTDGDL